MSVVLGSAWLLSLFWSIQYIHCDWGIGIYPGTIGGWFSETIVYPRGWYTHAVSEMKYYDLYGYNLKNGVVYSIPP